ncbi:MAG: hypothetical protein AAGG55_02400 [Pseudomonadota bacterium]
MLTSSPTLFDGIYLPVSARFVIDGSNLMLAHGRDNPELRYVLALLTHLEEVSESFRCFFDANSPYVLSDSPSDQLEVFENLVSIHRWHDCIEIVEGGTEADSKILAFAKHHRSEVISNDKYRTHAKDHKWIWKRRHGFVGTYDRLVIATLGIEISVMPTAAAYLASPSG